MVKILRENMRDMLFLDVFKRANFKYPPKKDGHMEKFFWGVIRRVENLPDRYTKKKKSLFVAFGQTRHVKSI